MRGSRRSCLLAIAVLMVAPVWLRGQSGGDQLMPRFALPVSPPVAQPATVEPFPARIHLPVKGPGTITLPVIARSAGTIFSGTVTAIARRPASARANVETVAVTFRVENAIRGATPGEDLTIAEWIGLWSAGQRYRVGEHLLLFLYPPSKLDLTSCVAGEAGRFTIDIWGRVLLSAQHRSAFQADTILGGKSRVRFADFALAVRRARAEE